MKSFFKKYYKLFILAILIFIFGFITNALLKDKLANFDTNIYNFIIHFKNPILTFFFKFITFLSNPPSLIVISIFLFFIFKNKKYGLLSLVSLIFITLTNQILKCIFERQRPINWMMIQENGYSFPSGHAMVSMAFYGVLIYLIWKTTLNIKTKKIISIILSFLIFLIGLSRIYLGVHYTSDIIAGFTISLSYVIILCSLINYYLKRKNV